MRMPMVIAGVCFAALTSQLMAVDAPASAPGYSVGLVQPAKLAETTIAYETVHATMEECGEPIAKAFPELYAKLQAAHIAPKGSPIVIFKSLQNKGGTPVDIDVAVPLPANTVAPEGFQVRVLPSIPSVTAIIRGPFSSLKDAYLQFFSELAMTGKVPQGELRQRTLYYEGPNSPNNIVLVEMQTAE